MTTLGAIVLPQTDPAQLRRLARAADESGLQELWIWEDSFWSGGIATMTAALSWTERVRVGVGIMPVPFRNVAATAMEAATLQRLFGDRPIIGLGHGVQDWMGQIGNRAQSPMTLLREYTTALKALLAGEPVTVDGRYVQLDRVKLDWTPTAPVEVVIGATGPKTLKLAGELGDGTILTADTSPGLVRESVGHIAPGPGHRVIVFAAAATGTGAEDRLITWRKRWGVERGVAGDAPAIADHVQALVEAGAHTVVLQPTEDDPDPEGFLRFVAEEVRPLVP